MVDMITNRYCVGPWGCLEAEQPLSVPPLTATALLEAGRARLAPGETWRPAGWVEPEGPAEPSPPPRKRASGRKKAKT